MFRYYELKNAHKKSIVEASLNPAEDKLLDNSKEEEEKLYIKLFTGRFKAPYHLYEREPGTGPLRTGTHLLLGEDMYSLMFVSFLNWDLVKKCTADNDEKEHLEEKMLKQFTKTHREK